MGYVKKSSFGGVLERGEPAIAQDTAEGSAAEEQGAPDPIRAPFSFPGNLFWTGQQDGCADFHPPLMPEGQNALAFSCVLLFVQS
jgi:hypothetical protein